MNCTLPHFTILSLLIFIAPLQASPLQNLETATAILRGPANMAALYALSNNDPHARQYKIAANFVRITNDLLSIHNSTHNLKYHYQEMLRIVQASGSLYNLFINPTNDQELSMMKKSSLHTLFLIEAVAALSAPLTNSALPLIDETSSSYQKFDYREKMGDYHFTQIVISITQLLSELIMETEWNEKAYCDVAILVASLAEAIRFSQQLYDEKEPGENLHNTSKVEAQYTNDSKSPNRENNTNTPKKETPQQKSNKPGSFREQNRQDYERNQKFYADLQEQVMKDLNDLNNHPHSNTHRNSSSRQACQTQNNNQSFEEKFEAMQDSIRQQKERLQKRKEDLRNARAEEQRRFDEELQKDEAAYQQRRAAEEQTAQKAAEERKAAAAEREAIDLKLQRVQEVLRRCHEEKLRQEQAEQNRKVNEDKKT